MSLHEGLISAIEQQPELFSKEDREDLVKQSSAWSEDSEELNGNVYQWLQTRPNIYRAALKNLSSKKSDRQEQLPIKSRLAGDGTNPPPINTKDHKATLLNAIHRNFDNPPPQQTRDNSHN